MFRRLLDRYSDALQRWPYRTNMCTAGFLWFSGDLISQHLEGKRFPIFSKKASLASSARALLSEPAHVALSVDDESVAAPPPIEWRRLLQMTTYGIFAAGPIYTWWYGLLDRRTLPLKAGSYSRV